MKLILLITALLFSRLSQAVIVELASDKAEYHLGDSIEVQLVVSDFSQLLGGFDSLVDYAVSGLTLTTWEFGPGFDDGLGSLQFAAHDEPTGIVSLSDYAFLFSDAQILAPLQGNSFVLATLRFSAAALGQFGLSVSNTSLVNFANDQLYFADDKGININVSSAAQVPAPASLLLLTLGLALMTGRRLSQKHQAV